jgi:hypothetical protein
LPNDNIPSTWKDLDEVFLIDVLEKVYKRLGYSVTNFHKTDRIHEDGVDLLCKMGNETIAIQTKMKPGTKDILQLNKLSSIIEGRRVYIYVNTPTKPFMETMEGKKSIVEFWDSKLLHNFLVENESIEYFCLYFSQHPFIMSLLKVHEFLIQKKNANYAHHGFTIDELQELWDAKDNSVKVWAPSSLISLKWNKLLMPKITKETGEFQKILDEIWDDLDTANYFSCEKLVYSFETLSEEHPDLLGLMWRLISNRTSWHSFTAIAERTGNPGSAIFYTHYQWICPVFDSSKKDRMRGFYSSMNYLLEHFAEIAKNIENAIDWVFANITQN